MRNAERENGPEAYLCAVDRAKRDDVYHSPLSPWNDERKRKQIEAAPKKSKSAKLIKLADKTSNLRTIASSPAAGWSVKRRLVGSHG